MLNPSAPLNTNRATEGALSTQEELTQSLHSPKSALKSILIAI
jgi:hypothetical protein